MTGKTRGVFVYGFAAVGALLPALLVATVVADPTRGGYGPREAHEKRGFDPRFQRPGGRPVARTRKRKDDERKTP